jgi:isoquinoline 1-oxidoreductase beta subunit
MSDPRTESPDAELNEPEVEQAPQSTNGTASAEGTETPAKKRRWRVTRRGFLIGAGIAGGALALGYFVGLPALHLSMAESLDAGGEGGPSAFSEDPWVWFEISESGRIRIYLNKVEMGQGIHTSLAQIAAEELGLELADIEVAQASTSRGMPGSVTGASNSISSSWMPIRTMSATFRAMLAAEAATALGVASDALTISAMGFSVSGNPAQAISFTDLMSGKQGEWEVPEAEVPLKSGSYRVIGQSAPRVDIPLKVTGEGIYGYDLRVPGMKYGAVLRPPTLEGKATSISPGGAESMPGVVKVVIEEGWAGVVAETRAQAYAAVNALEVVWDEGKLWTQEEIDAIVVPGPESGAQGVVIQNEGNAQRELNVATTLSVEYRTPFAVQTPLEAQAGMAEPIGEGESAGLRVYVSTQAPASAQQSIAQITGLRSENVEVTPTLLGGGFGRKSGFEVAIEAARLAKAAGLPVHVGWNRSEEMRYGFLRPSTSHIFYGRIEGQGAAARLVAAEHRQASAEVAFSFLPGFLTIIFGADFGSTRGARFHYGGIENRHVVAFRPTVPVYTGWWRGLGLLANTFAVESFMDEAAHAAGADPLEFRLAHFSDDPRDRRIAAVLTAANELATAAGPVPEGRARGVAACIDVDTAVGQVVEISLDRATGVIRVHNVWAAMDCGLVINPDGAKAQIEGNIMWGVGSALMEEARVVEGRIEPTNFDSYPVLRMREAPHVESILIDNAGDGKPRGVGEPPTGPVAAAVGNAFFNLTGVRLRELPFTPERVLAALEA